MFFKWFDLTHKETYLTAESPFRSIPDSALISKNKPHTSQLKGDIASPVFLWKLLVSLANSSTSMFLSGGRKIGTHMTSIADIEITCNTPYR